MTKIFKINNRGISLLEMIIAISIFSFVIMGISALYLTSRKYQDIIWEQLKTQNEGRKVVQDFVNELRVALPSSIGAYSIASASSTQIVFYTNLDSDTLMERVRYFFVTSTLKKGVIKPTGNPLVYNSANEKIVDVAHDTETSTSKFTYYGSNFTGTEAPLSSPIDVTKIRVVGIALTMEENPNASPVPFSIESKVMVRNLKDN